MTKIRRPYKCKCQAPKTEVRLRLSSSGPAAQEQCLTCLGRHGPHKKLRDFVIRKLPHWQWPAESGKLF